MTISIDLTAGDLLHNQPMPRPAQYPLGEAVRIGVSPNLQR